MSCKLFSVILLSFLFFYIVECGTKKSWKIEKIIKSDEARSTSSATTEIPDIKITSTTAPPTTTADLIDDNATIVNDFEEEDEEEQEDEDNSIEAEDLKLDIVETEKNETKISLEDVANMTIDETSSTVNVTLNGEKVKQIFTGSKLF
jgi:maltodextrin utilization protein YvdJ